MVDADTLVTYTGTPLTVRLGSDQQPSAIQSASTAAASGRVSVYGLNGVRLRQNVEADKALLGLPRSVYIVGNRKMAN